MATASSLVATYSPIRGQMYSTLIAAPDMAWSVRELASRLPAEARVSPDAVRANLYFLLGDGIVTLARGHRVFTLRLTAKGAVVLRAILADWKDRGLRVPS
jgi:hypothetical protein